MNKLIETMVRHDEPSAVSDIDAQSLASAIEQIHQRFVDERVNGFTHPETGQVQEPVSREDAERRWQAALPRFQQVLLKAAAKADHPANDRLRLSKGTLPASSDYGAIGDVDTGPLNPEDLPPDPALRGGRAMRDEPALRRGESKARTILKQLMA